MSQGKKFGYWGTTILVSLAFTGGGLANVMLLEQQQASMQALGFPIYIMTLLGIFKLLGVITLLMPGLPTLKEWAYAGFTFDLIGAAYAHAINGDPVETVIPPLVLLGLVAASYALRPENRRLPPLPTDY